MYKDNLPHQNDLPTSRQLAISTVVALVTATVLLVTVVLPAEYGIDPTGVGRALGLTQMGEIKVQLAEEAKIETAEIVELQEQPKEMSLISPQSVEAPAAESITVMLAPGEAAEVKLIMNKSARATYAWTVDTGHVNFDTHGDNAGIDYHNYSKAKAVSGDEGELIAAFDGSHGWFWRNRSNETVNITLNVSGEFTAMKRVL
ncbi:MAG: transmembrane anchor protein [Gammaproteobacteria bacterium]|nr:transmembrane anchor protein [Gammaproteobacteria bacterium]